MNGGMKNENAGQDGELAAWLKRHDPVRPPSAMDLIRLENRIMAQIDVSTDLAAVAVAPLPLATVSKEWALRAMIAGTLFVMLGFFAGRDLDNLSLQPAEQTALFASAGPTPLQLLISTSTSGINNDVSE
jgi:hypothetical protein